MGKHSKRNRRRMHQTRSLSDEAWFRLRCLEYAKQAGGDIITFAFLLPQLDKVSAGSVNGGYSQTLNRC